MVLAWVPTVGDSCLSLRLESYANTIKLLNYKPSLPGYMTGFLKPCSSQCGPQGTASLSSHVRGTSHRLHSPRPTESESRGSPTAVYVHELHPARRMQRVTLDNCPHVFARDLGSTRVEKELCISQRYVITWDQPLWSADSILNGIHQRVLDGRHGVGGG